MLTSFFRKSKPINYIILPLLLLVGFIIRFFVTNTTELSFQKITFFTAIIVLLVFTILLLDFIIRKNAVNQPNTFSIFLFVLFVIMTPSIFSDLPVVLATIFMLLALRRILSLQSDKNLEKKIFDAAMYITIASFFEFWTVLFFIVLYISIIRKTSSKFRYFVIPLLACIAIVLIAVAFTSVYQDSFVWITQLAQPMGFNFSMYNTLTLIVPAIVLVVLLLGMGVSRVFQYAALSKKEQPAAATILFMSFICVLIIIVLPVKSGAELLYLCPPVAILTTNFIEQAKTKERWIFNEIFLWFLVVVSFLVDFI